MLLTFTLQFKQNILQRCGAATERFLSERKVKVLTRRHPE